MQPSGHRAALGRGQGRLPSLPAGDRKSRAVGIDGVRLPRAPMRIAHGLRDRAAVAAVAPLGLGPAGWVRLAVVASAPLAAIWMGLELSPITYLVVPVWVALSSRHATGWSVTAVDLLVALALTTMPGGVVSPFLLFTMYAVSAVGMRWGIHAGVAAGALVSLTQGIELGASGRLESLPPDVLVPVLALLPITGLTGALAVRVFRSERSGRAVLEEANRLLVALQRMAADMPGGLDVATVAAAALAEIRTIAHPPAAMVYAGRGGVLQPAASETSGTPPRATSAQAIERIVGDADHRIVATASLRGPLARTCAGRPFWTVVPLRVAGTVNGAFLIGHDEVSTPRRCTGALVTLAADTALALDNARLFDGAASRAADAARRHIAHDLHDTVAQSLAHLKMELELLGLASDDPGIVEETDRLARVTERALSDVRATIAGLMSDATDGGLVDALQQHITDLCGLGRTEITFEPVVDGRAEIDEELRPEILRVAQEAISNAVRHAGALHVAVSLEIDDDVTQLVVEDDGHGIPARPMTQEGHGVGIRAMHERAAALGGRLTIRDRVGGGTVVSLQCPSRMPAERRRRGRRQRAIGRQS